MPEELVLQISPLCFGLPCSEHLLNSSLQKKHNREFKKRTGVFLIFFFNLTHHNSYTCIHVLQISNKNIHNLSDSLQLSHFDTCTNSQ